MSISESLYFVYDGISSVDVGILNVSLSNGLFEETFASEVEIVETKVRGNDRPYFTEIIRSPITINVNFYFEDTWDDEKIRFVSRWLCGQNYYKELYFSENPDRRFYAIYNGDPRLIHNGLKQGYVTMQFRCDSPYSYSPVYSSPIYDLSANTTDGTSITYTNSGDVDIHPKLLIEKIGDGDIKIVNFSDGGNEFEIVALADNEYIIVDGENQDIESDIPGVYRYANLTTDFLSIPRGVNNLMVYGTCKLQFISQFKTLQG